MRVTRSLIPALVAVFGVGFASSGQAACYTVYRGNAIAYRSIVVPVDLSKPLHLTVPVGFGPGATMVIAESADGCRTVDNRAEVRVAGATRRPVAGMAGSRAGRRQAEAEQWLENRAEPIRSEIGVDTTSGDRGETARSDSNPAMRSGASGPTGAMR